MKKSIKNIFFGVAALSMAVAVGAGLGLADKKEVKPVEAASTTRLYLDMTSFADWYSAGATFKVHTWNNANGDKYFAATKASDTYYYADVDLATYASGGGYRFSRFSSDGNTEWNKGAWNSYADGVNVYYMASGYTDGTWSIPESDWSIKGSTTEPWSTTNINISISSVKFDSDGLQYYSLTVSLTQGSVFKIVGGSNWYGFEHLSTYGGQSALEKGYFENAGTADDNIRVLKSGTFEVYINPFTASTWIQIDSNTEAAAYASDFLSSITCTDTSVTSDLSAWNKVGAATTSMEYKYEHLTSGARNLLKTATANKDGTKIEQCVARYDRILSKYGYGTATGQYHDFMSRTPALQNTSIKLLFGNGTSTEATVIIVTVTALAAIAVGGYFLLKKKRA